MGLDGQKGDTVAFRLLAGESVEEGVRRIVVEQIDRALTALSAGGRDDGDLHEGVHDARKRCKKIRAVLRLVRPALGDTYRSENARFRDAGRLLSDARDAAAIIETFDDQIAEPFRGHLDDRRLAVVRDALVARRDELTRDLDVVGLVGEFTERLHAGRDAAAGWELSAQDWQAIGPGLGKTYARGRKAMVVAYDDATTEAFHEWRKRVKYHRYHMKLLGELWPGPVTARRKACHVLSDYLGDDHDLAVFRGVLQAEADRFDEQDLRLVIGAVDRRRGELQTLARPEGERIFAEPAERFVERFGLYWSAWQSQPGDGAAFAAPLATHPAA